MEDAPQACNQGGQEGGFRQGCHGEGEAGEDCREGVPSSRPEEAVLRPNPMSGFAASDLKICSVGVPRNGLVRQSLLQACRSGLCDQECQMCRQITVFLTLPKPVQ